MKIRGLCISIIIAVLAVAAVSFIGCGNGRGGGGKSAGPAPAGVTAAPVRDQAATPPAGVTATPVTDQAPAPPAMPTGVTATPDSDRITISWPEVAGATSYNIYWSLFPGVTTTNGTTVSVATGPYTHTSLTVETTYYYIVTALNASGESAASSQVNVTTFTPAQTKSFLRYRRAMKQY